MNNLKLTTSVENDVVFKKEMIFKYINLLFELERKFGLINLDSLFTRDSEDNVEVIKIRVTTEFAHLSGFIEPKNTYKDWLRIESNLLSLLNLSLVELNELFEDDPQDLVKDDIKLLISQFKNLNE
jgi:hypothetical protein